MSLAEMLIKSPKKLKLFLNTIPIPIYAWQIHRNNLFLIGYNSAAYEETKGEIKNNLGSIASEYYKENIDLIDVLKECADKSTSISKEIKYFCSISNELKSLLIKTDYIPPDLVLVQEISKTKQILLEQKVKESEEKYRLISENAQDILILTNKKYKIEYVNNHALKKLLGYTEKEVIGRVGFDFIHPDDLKKTIDALKKGIEKGEGLIEVRARHKKGHYIWIEATGKTFNDDSGVLKGIIILRDIGKRKSFEIKLKESEENYRLITEESNDLIRVLNDKFEIEDVNNNTLQNFIGYTKQELLGKNTLFLNHPNDYTEVRRFMLKLFKFGENIHETRIKHKNGKWVWVENKAKMFTDEKNDQKYLFISRDITERKKIERVLIESEEKYRHLFDTSPFMIVLIKSNGEIIDFNQSSLKYLIGYSRDDLVGKNFLTLEFLPKNHLEVLKEIYNELLNKGYSKPIEFKMNPLKSNLRGINLTWIELQCSLITVRTEKLIQVIIKDISAKKEAELKLKESEEKYRLITENIHDLVVILNKKFKIKYANTNALFNMLGYSNKDFISKNALEFIYSDDQQKVFMDFIRFREKGRGSTIARIIHEQGQIIWTETNSTKFLDQDGIEKALIIIRDITERKEAEEKLIESKEKYRAAYKQADFYKNLFAHDISNILTVIYWSSQLCSNFLQKQDNLKFLKENMVIINKQINRALNLIKNVQKLSKLDDVKGILEPIEICKILKECVNYIYNSYREKIVNIEVKSPKNTYTVYANELLRDVFENIFINGIKYNQNAVIEIIVMISVDEKKEGFFLKMEFIDNGIGITDDRKEIIFQKRFEKDEYSKGMGFGLTLVKKIIDSYKGDIWIKDRIPGDHTQGSNFMVLIPLL